MKRWSARQLLALFLAIFVSVGMGLSAVEASTMTAKMAMASGAGPGDCQGCPTGSDDGGMKAMGCNVTCVAPVLATLPEGAPAPFVADSTSLVPARYALLHGRTSPPDPYPPRPTDIG